MNHDALVLFQAFYLSPSAICSSSFLKLMSVYLEVRFIFFIIGVVDWRFLSNKDDWVSII